MIGERNAHPLPARVQRHSKAAQGRAWHALAIPILTARLDANRCHRLTLFEKKPGVVFTRLRSQLDVTGWCCGKCLPHQAVMRRDMALMLRIEFNPFIFTHDMLLEALISDPFFTMI
jgi:hypothetical protein